MDSSAKISNDQRLRRNHLELINTIKRESKNCKNMVGEVIKLIESDEFNNTLKKTRNSIEEEKIDELKKTLTLEKKEINDLKKTLKQEKNERDNYSELIKTLERQINNLEITLNKENKEINKLTEQIEEIKNKEEEKDVVIDLKKNNSINKSKLKISLINSQINQSSNKNKSIRESKIASKHKINNNSKLKNSFLIGSKYDDGKGDINDNEDNFNLLKSIRIINEDGDSKNYNFGVGESIITGSIMRPLAFYSCVFIDKKNIKNILKNDIEKNKSIVMEIFFVNDGRIEWPKDSMLKCINDDYDIYFLSTYLTDNQLEYSKNKKEEFTSQFIEIYFKNYNKIECRKYCCELCLYSDLKGLISQNNGTIEINVE